jgi:hypothetical protein
LSAVFFALWSALYEIKLGNPSLPKGCPALLAPGLYFSLKSWAFCREVLGTVVCLPVVGSTRAHAA